MMLIRLADDYAATEAVISMHGQILSGLSGGKTEDIAAK
jgi:hypothetical protein